MKYYKILDENSRSPYAGTKYNLPTKKDGEWIPGEWMPTIEGAIIECRVGYHLCRTDDIIHWLDAEIYEAEIGEFCIEFDRKVATEKIRLLRKIETWTEKTARLFAVWCARESFKITEPTQAEIVCVNVAEKYALGKATQEELASAWESTWESAWESARESAGESPG